VLVTTIRIATLLAMALCASAAAQTAPPPGVILFNPAKVQWFRTAIPGGQWAPIQGNPSHPGQYVYAAKVPPGTVTLPHIFPDTRSYTVISGTFYVGFGDRFDDAKLVALPPGSYYLAPAGKPYFTATRKESVVLQISGIGPSKQTVVDPASP
jgi:hypothetical protein